MPPPKACTALIFIGEMLECPPPGEALFMPASKAKIAVLIEEHFDGTEFRRFNDYFPQHGYHIEYVSHLWGQPSLTFGNTPDHGVVDLHVTVTIDIAKVKPADYAGVLPSGA